ncbi:hypothetical protein VTJ83DRAFT_4601 [Remersonia thermophila]|uniref:E3 ubiquitin-protein ligase listerin n=1 Tax=Remersonia thermophila TaxID=72144 RepID=A0ABR4DAE7_9PEZI
MSFGRKKPGASFGGFGASATTLSYLTPPPDFSAIPHEVVVQYKNLLKKDSTTKEKALQDILAYVRRLGPNPETLEEAVIDTYIDLYPRLSIDDSPRVRELSHQLLFHLLNAAKKRMAKKLPSFVGPWLAGIFDRNKGASRAATDALAAFLKTKEKEEAFWKAVQTQVLEFAIEAIRETPGTLSDERVTTAEDLAAKYHRVVGASLSLALHAFKKGDAGALEDGLTRYLETDALWDMPKTDDSFVRKAYYQFLLALLAAKPELLEPHLQKVARALVHDSMKKSQSGSATDLLKALAALTKRFPQVWGTKKHPLQALQQFVAQGSQGGDEEYWLSLEQLLRTIPDREPPVNIVSAFLASVRKGAADRRETTGARNQAFKTYGQVFDIFLQHTPLSTSFLEENLVTLTRQYLHPSSGSSTPVPQRPEPLAATWVIVARHQDDETQAGIREEWQKMADAFTTRMANSLPEVSEGYQKSQASIAFEGQLWFAFTANILAQPAESTALLSNVVTTASAHVLRGAVDLLVRRNFKPFGAASVIQSAFRHSPGLCADQKLLESLFPADEGEVFDRVVTSQSLPYLVSDLNTITGGDDGRFGEIWSPLVEAALKLPDRGQAISAVRVLIGIPSAAPHAHQNSSLQAFLVSLWKAFVTGEAANSGRDLCEATLSYHILVKESLAEIANEIVAGLEVPTTRDSASAALELLLAKRRETLTENGGLHVRLVTNLLALTEISDGTLSAKAKKLKTLLDEQPTAQNHVAAILENHLEEAGPSSLDVDTLLQQALDALKTDIVSAEDIFPSSTVWMEELSAYLQRVPNPSLSLTSSMGGAYFLVQGAGNLSSAPLRRDSSGRSIPARMALFTAKLFSSGVDTSSLPPEFLLELVYLLCLTEAVVLDQLSVPQAGGLWNDGPETESRLQEFCDLSNSVIRTIVTACGDWTNWTMAGDSLIERLVNFMLHEAVGLKPKALYAAKALSSLLQLLVQTHGGAPANLEEWVTKLGIMRVAPNTTFATAAFLTGFGEALASSKTVATLCTRLVSELPGIREVSDGKALVTLVMLNLCMDVYEASTVPVETRKQVLALQQLTRWTENPEKLGYQAASEICKSIIRLLPGTKDTYGPYWEQAIKYCLELWVTSAAGSVQDQKLPYLHASLKLMQALRAAEDPNDDLVEALAEHKGEETAALITLLGAPHDDTASMPSQQVDALLARTVRRLQNVRLEDLEDIYEAVASESREIQRAAFGLLHNALPAAQEDINLAVVLDKKAANLPSELLSLLLNAPYPQDYTDEDLASFPTPIRSYLLAWHLVFDAYSKASFRVRNDYTDNVKSGKHLDPLMAFLVDVLGHAAAKPLNLDRAGFTTEHIRSYSIDLADAELPERDMNWLLIHLFYLVLKYIPGLFKLWYLDCSSNQTRMAIQAWMEKFFSPLIIADALDEVVEWSAKQGETASGSGGGGGADAQEITVKVSKSAREVTAGYPVDDDAATIALRVPKSYPLDPVDVVGVKRVAVKEDMWQAWLMGTKAVIMFGNCNLVDGLTAFRRNISLALKGQEECAICYSIIAQDKTLPDKRCGTCNHSFHRVCLYKWFQNSGRNTCPLCRNAIDYLGSDTKRRRPEHE